MFAHEIRTTLTGILAFSELLATADLGPRERQWASAVSGAAEHLAALSTLIIDADKARAAELALRRETFRPRLLALSVADSLSARAAAKGLTATVTIADDLPEHVRGDPVRLRAALENLIDNAAKFTARGGVGLNVGAEAAPNRKVRLIFEVSDTGRGLTRAEIARLFRPYAQASRDVARLFGGAGLGLIAVKSIAAAMGGDLTVTSTAGKGSRFRLEVIVARARPPHVRRNGRAEQAAMPTSRPLRLLCAEDNPFGRVILDTILTELGHAVDFVGNGEAAVEAVKRGGYDAVLMDVALPVVDGIAATRSIRALPPPAGAAPIIGISGATDPNENAAARRAGMTFYLHKPVSPPALAQALAAVVSGAADQPPA